MLVVKILRGLDMALLAPLSPFLFALKEAFTSAAANNNSHVDGDDTIRCSLAGPTAATGSRDTRRVAGCSYGRRVYVGVRAPCSPLPLPGNLSTANSTTISDSCNHNEWLHGTKGPHGAAAE